MCSGVTLLQTRQDFSCNRFTVIPRLIMAISTKHFKNRCLKGGTFQALNKTTWFSETRRSDWRRWEAAVGREGHGWPGPGPCCGAGGPVWSHSSGGVGTGSSATSFPSGFPAKGWSNLGSRGRRWMLSSASAGLDSIRDAGTMVTVVHFWFSMLHSLPLAVLHAVETEGWGAACPAILSCAGWAGVPWRRGQGDAEHWGLAEQTAAVPLCRWW